MADGRTSVNVEEVDVATLRTWMETGQATARQIVEAYIARIEAIDSSLRSVLEVNPDALAIADGLDRERAAGQVRGPLHGIPILLKDNIDSADQMETTAGSLALLGSQPARDATVAAQLRAAGAILLGKTNMSEWANFRSTRSSSGWSGRGRQCRNPYALDRTPGGSSSGSGVAPAASLCAVAIGTETNGSIVSPANASGVVGIKPTVGLTSRAGVIPISHTQDTIGPLARSVADAAAVLSAMTGPDPRDAATEASAGNVQSDYTAFLDANGLSGARIGVARLAYFGYSEHADALVNAAIDVMRQHGAIVVDPANIPTAKQLGDWLGGRDVLLYEFKADLNAYLAERGHPSIHTLADVIAFNEANKQTEMPYFGQETFTQAQEKGPLSDDAYIEALAHCRRLSRAEGVDVAFAKDKLDAIVAPTGGPAWLIDWVNGDCFSGGGNSSIAAVAGYPTITVPAGYSFGLPVGMSLIGKPWTEALLLKLAYAYEQAAKPRRPPKFLATADLSRR